MAGGALSLADKVRLADNLDAPSALPANTTSVKHTSPQNTAHRHSLVMGTIAEDPLVDIMSVESSFHDVRSSPVKLFSKSYYLFFGYFDPSNTFFDNKNK